MRVVLTFDDRELQTFLKSWQEPAVKKTLKAAASTWGRTVKPILKAGTPVSKPGNKYAPGGAGNLQRLTRYKQFGARYGIGVVVGPMSKKPASAFYRRFVVGGTKPHIILPKSQGGRLKIAGGFASAVHHPGAKANPYVERVGRAAEQLGFNAAELTIYAGLDAQRVTETTDS